MNSSRSSSSPAPRDLESSAATARDSRDTAGHGSPGERRPSAKRSPEIARWMAALCALTAIGIALVSLWFWWNGNRTQGALDLQNVPMAPSTALVVVVLGIALLLKQFGTGQSILRTFKNVAISIAGTIAIAVIVQDLFNLNRSWEQWLAGGPATIRGSPVGQMSPFTAAVVLLATVRLATFLPSLAEGAFYRRTGLAAALLGSAASALSVIGHATGIAFLVPLGFVSMAYPTAIGLLAINAGLLLTRRPGTNAGGLAGPGFKTRPRRAPSSGEVLIIAFAASSIGFIALACPLYLYGQQRSLKAGITGELTAIAALKVHQVSTWREERLRDARQLMRTPLVVQSLATLDRSPDNSALRAELAAWMEELVSAQDIEIMALFDRERRPVVVMPATADVSEPVLRQLLRSAIGRREPLEHGIHPSPTGRTYMDIVAPVYNADAQLGIILLRINPGKMLYPLLHRWPVLSGSGETLLFSREGDRFIYLGNDPHHAGVNAVNAQAPSRIEDRLARSQGGVLEEGVDYWRRPVVAVGQSVPDTPLFLATKIDQAEAYGPMRREAVMVATAAVALLCAFAMGSGLLWRQQKHERLQREFKAERERRVIAERLALVMAHANEIILVMDSDGRIIEANRRAVEAYGYSLEELRQLTVDVLRAESSPPTPESVFNSPAGVVFEGIHARRDGSTFPVEVSGSTFEADGRRFNLGIYRDISQRKAQEEQIARLTRLYAALSQINQAIVRTTERTDLFAAICHALVEFGGFKMAWIAWRDTVTKHIAPAASFGDAGGFLWEIELDGGDGWDGSDSTIAALREGRTKVCHDLSGDAVPTASRANAARHGFGACIALPIRMNDVIVGALTVYAAERGSLGDKEVALLEEAVTDMVFALGNFEREALRLHARVALHQSEKEHRMLFLNHPMAMWVYDTETLRFVSVNDAAVRNYGYTREEMLTMTIKDIRPAADVPALLDSIARPRGTIVKTGPWRHRKKNGEIILVEVSSDGVSLDGRPARLVMAEDVTERWQAEEALKKSEERFRSLFTNLVEGFAYCRMVFEDGQPADIVCLEVNPAFTRLTGLSDAIGRKATAIIPGIRESNPELFERFGRVARTGRPERFETYIAKLKMWLDISAYRPEPECVIAVFDDITERKLHDEQLALLNTALLAAPDSIVITDELGVIKWVNPGFSRSSGYSLEEAIGRHTRVLNSGRQSGDFYADLWRTITSGQSWHGEFVNKRKDGTIFIEEATIAPVRDSAGAIRHYVAIKHDITARKQTKSQIREQAELLDKANDAIVVINLDNRITFWNRAAARLFGWSAEEMIGKPVSHAFALGTDLGDLGGDGAVPPAGGHRRKLHGQNRRGDHLVIETSVTVLRDEAGHPTGRLSISTDVTENETLQEKFLRTQRLESIGMLAAGITHDLNNVLAPIAMVSDLLRNHLSEPSDLQLLDALDQCAVRGSGLVRQILGFVHGVGGEFRIVQIKHLIRDIVEVIKATYPKSIVLEESFSRDLWPVRANPTQIHQVLLNLCVNARDAMPDGGTLRLRAENRLLDANSIRGMEGCEAGLMPKPGPWLMLEVADTGTGIPPEMRAKIWQPFFTTKSVDRGTGLGLSTVRGVVENHHGFIALQTAPGRGSTFQVYLPAATAGAPIGDDSGAPATAHGHGELILLADDEEFIRAATTAVLTKAGYEVVAAHDGTEASAIFERHAQRIALVITDVDMPKLGGAGLARLIRNRRPGIKVLAMSGAGSTHHATTEPPDQFASAFLPKPFTAEALLTAVDRVLHEPGSTCEPKT